MYIKFQDYSVVDPSTEAPININHSMHLNYLNGLVLLMLYIAKSPTHIIIRYSHTTMVCHGACYAFTRMQFVRVSGSLNVCKYGLRSNLKLKQVTCVGLVL